MNRSLETSSMYLKGVGPRFGPIFDKLGLRTVRDVLFYVPRRYEDRRDLPPISSVRAGQYVTVRGRVIDFEGHPTRRGGMVILKAAVSDKSGTILLTWFNQPWIKKALQGYKGEIIAYGLAREGQYSGYEINSPEYELIGDEDEAADFARIMPVYPLTEGLSQKTLRKAAQSAVEGYADLVQDTTPNSVIRKFGLMGLEESLRTVHQPENLEIANRARERLVFDEFLALQLALALKHQSVAIEAGISFSVAKLITAPVAAGVAGEGQHLFDKDMEEVRNSEPLWDQIHKMLPFELTGAQKRTLKTIWEDMEIPHPMNRLVQGDVGSGKTAVAACAMLTAARCGYQAALMAPTEILAEQHHANLVKLFEPLGLEVALLVGKQTPKQKKAWIERTSSGAAHLAVGTHALIQEGVEFKNLGLVIIDEQHRFGVLQRAALRGKGVLNPDVVVMTATPIPRTLSMTIYGDLDVSVIDELPPGRKPIKTHWRLPSERETVYQGVHKLLQEGRQAYFVCPMVSESEKLLAQAATDLHYRLSTSVFPDFKIGLLHGQMKSLDKEQVMAAFRAHELDVLVSTTVIEVGVDVPNASVMVIEDANRFGLSQLHQLRGRVGRGEHKSFCILIAEAKNDDAAVRMQTMVETSDGFKIAETDLELRGPGDLIGTKQSGNLGLSIADLIRDQETLLKAREAAFKLVAADPGLSRPEHVALREVVKRKYADAALVAVS